ncbi:hypothetical protein [Poritiphilus flavus]|uniref:Uncharacterized protein n=1 Tax=Poritiphilus flavus TaxID=2697053 RepID=A0A6L9EF32_9FLAO|nr:hypothetical protein [Poritiphilus flavus]NAS13281.1 hypothetical protein [Poritiphilus flavus]
MSRKSTDRISLYEGLESTLGPADKNQAVLIRPGSVLRLGSPVNQMYSSIYPSLEFKEHTLADLKSLKKLKGMIVVVISILTLTQGAHYAVLRPEKNKNFHKNLDRLYAEIPGSLEKKELLKL